jgi:class 3 adenylate cyclase/tetratricopeptide (TPR) repeat protein
MRWIPRGGGRGSLEGMVQTMSACPSCGALAPDGARFCPTCGSPISLPTDERRIVTVLFADVVGFTSMSERADPEQIKNTIDACFDKLASDVTAFGGRVDKIVGDQLMAIFGAPTAHEDDAERAVRAALQIQQSVAEHTRENGSDLRVRIGVNTGEVLVGAIRAGGDVTAMGDVVNTAHRLQTSAQPGQVLVGPDTYAATRGVIRYTSVGALQAKGREAPVEAYEAVVPLGPPGSRPNRRRTSLVGRKAELGMLWHALSTSAAHQRPHLLLLIGDAGVGKTRLIEEAIEIARGEHKAQVLEGRCLPYGEANAWWPVAEALRQACEITPEDPSDVAAEKCRTAVAGLVGTADEGAEAARVADGLLYLMGYEASLHEVDPARAQDEAVRSIQISLAALAQRRPLVIVLSELHWADDLVLELVDRMFERLRNLPLVVLATARPEIEDRWTPRPGRHNMIVLNLEPLDREASERLAQELLGTALPRDMLDTLIERSGGNPLFLEELVALLGESVATGNGQQEVRELPATLRGLVAARLDSLPGEERAVLEDASVAGRRALLEALEVMAGTRGERDITGVTERLAAKDLVSVDDRMLEFKSELVRDVAYSTLTKGDRARRHAALGEWLAGHAQRTDREDELLERIAFHYATAAEFIEEVGTVEGVASDVRQIALEWLGRTIKRMAARETWGVTLAPLDQALRLVGDEPSSTHREILLARGKARSALRDIDGARADALQMVEESEAATERRGVARGLTLLGEVERLDGRLDAALATLDRALRIWRELEDPSGEAEAVRYQGMAMLFGGETEDAEECFSRARELYRSVKDRRGEAWAVQHLAWVAFQRGQFDLAEQRLGEAEAMFVEVGDFGGQGWCLGLLGYVRYFQGDLEGADVIATTAVEWTRDMGDKWAQGMMINLVASVRLWQGHTAEALDRSTEAVRILDEIDDDYGRLVALMPHSWALALSGRGEEARDIARRGLEVGRRVTSMGRVAVLHVAHIATLLGDGRGALDALNDDAADHRDADVRLDVVAQVLATQAFALAMAGRLDEASAPAERGVEASEDPGDFGFGLCVRALVRTAVGRPEAALEDAGRLAASGEGSYMDKLRGQIAAALASARLGLAPDAEAALEAARARLRDSEDQVSRAIVELTAAIVAEALDGQPSAALPPARRRLQELGVTTDGGWETFLRAGAGLEG